MSDLDEARIEWAVDEAVADLIADDVSIVASPAIIGRLNCPVMQRLVECVKDPGWGVPDRGLSTSTAELAAALRLPVELVERYPVVDEFGVAAHALDVLGFADVETDDLSDDLASRVSSAASRWADRQSPGVGPRIPPAGLERDFETWLEANLDRLSAQGFPVRLAEPERDGRRGRQVRLQRQSTADLVCRFTEDSDVAGARSGDWLVIGEQDGGGQSIGLVAAGAVRGSAAGAGRGRGAWTLDRGRRDSEPRARPEGAGLLLPLPRRHWLPGLPARARSSSAER